MEKGEEVEEKVETEESDANVMWTDEEEKEVEVVPEEESKEEDKEVEEMWGLEGEEKGGEGGV